MGLGGQAELYRVGWGKNGSVGAYQVIWGHRGGKWVTGGGQIRLYRAMGRGNGPGGVARLG